MKREVFNEAIVLFFAQVLLCTIIAINYRAISQAHYLFTALSSMGIAGITYFLIQRISDNHKKRKKSKQIDFAWIGFMLGSVVGDVVGIYFSKLLLGS
jgi:hypothetical protein